MQCYNTQKILMQDRDIVYLFLIEFLNKLPLWKGIMITYNTQTFEEKEPLYTNEDFV